MDCSELMGSGVHGKQLNSVYCANLGNCNNLGSKTCKNCKLVAYCSKDRECQTQHWKLHKSLCKSPLMQDSWSPCWIKESRTPSFVVSDPDIHQLPQYPFHAECLWGNIPAYGVLGSAQGHALPNHLRVCFAASGDLRNVIETVCQIPADFKGKATFYVNDGNAKVMVRNFLMLEMLRLHGSQAIDAVIALWYSIALTSAQLKAMMTLARQVQSWALEQEYADMYEYSLLITYFMNWHLIYNIVQKFMIVEVGEKRLVQPATTAAELEQALSKSMQWGLMHAGFIELSRRLLVGGVANWYAYFHDFSKAFDEYLGSMQGALQAAERAGVERMQKHVAVPHRLFVGVSASTSTTPALHGDLEDFYICKVLHFNSIMTERFVEWTKT